MSATSTRRWLAIALACGTAACARNPAPRHWLQRAEVAQSDPYGAWIVVEKKDADTLRGEFLAVQRDSVFVLTPDSTVRTVPIDSVVKAKVAFYDSRYAELAGWTALGSLSTISNGAFLIFTLPAWMIGGTLATADQSLAPIVDVDDMSQWVTVRKYARFPAGLPDNLPRKLPTKLRR